MSAYRDMTRVGRLLAAEADRMVWHGLAAALVVVVIASVLAALAPLALKGMVDAVAGTVNTLHAPSTATALFGVAYLLALAGGRLLSEIRPVFAGVAEQRLYARMTQTFFAHLLDLRMSYHLERPTGALMQTLGQATMGCQIIVSHLVGSVVPVFVEIMATALVLVHLDQPLLLTVFAGTALTYLIVFASASLRVTDRARGVSSASLDLQATVTDCLLNCEAIKSFAAEPSALQRVVTATSKVESSWSRLHRLRASSGVAVTATFALSVTATLVIAADAVAAGTLTVGGFVLANVYMLQMVRPLEMLGTAARDLSQAMGFVGPLLDVIDEPVEAPMSTAHGSPPTGDDSPAPTAHAPPLRFAPPRVHFSSVCFGYVAHRAVLKGLELEIAPGRTLGIVGASGSGKSSTARLLQRLYEPQSGRILLDDRSIQEWDLRELRGSIGVVPQDTMVFNDTFANNIALAKPHAARTEIVEAARRASLHDLISSLPDGYNTLVGERGLKLSGGERQRLAIARVLLKRPRLFVFDEATSMLDSATEVAVLQNLREISDGCTTITIAHRLSTVVHADEIAVIDDGVVAEHGGHSDLLSLRGSYARLWQMQSVVGLTRSKRASSPR